MSTARAKSLYRELLRYASRLDPAVRAATTQEIRSRFAAAFQQGEGENQAGVLLKEAESRLSFLKITVG